MDKGDFAIHKAADKHIVGSRDFLKNGEYPVPLRMPPPTSFDGFPGYGLGEPRDGTLA